MAKTNNKTHTTQQSVNSTVKTICDIMRRSNVAGAMEYVPELSWLLFLRILDERETVEARRATMQGLTFTPSLEAPYRWQDWAAPNSRKRKEIQEGEMGRLFPFLHDELFPYLHKLGDPTQMPHATQRQRVIGRVMAGVRRARIDTEFNMWEVIDKVHDIRDDRIDKTHIFPLSQVYEGLLLKMGEKRNDGGQFFTPREVIRAMIEAVRPELGKTIYDPACGTGGFLAQAYNYLEPQAQSPAQRQQLKERTFYGSEKDNTIFPIGLANLVLHGIDRPNLWHGNRLTGQATYSGLFTTAPAKYDYIFTNPPFGGKEGKNAQKNFDYPTSATQVLFLQYCISQLKEGGTCAIVMDEGVLFRTTEDGFVKTKRKLLTDCRVEAIISLPGGVFTQAGAGVKTNILIFSKGQPTQTIWYYDLSHLKIRKRTPLTRAHFDHFFKVYPDKASSEFSWMVDMDGRKAKAREEAQPFYDEAARLEKEIRQKLAQIRQLKSEKKTQSDEYKELNKAVQDLRKEARQAKAKGEAVETAVYDLKAVNPNNQVKEDTRTPEDLITIIEAKGREVAVALALLKG
ncbi:MAG: N-6 DNA methylase [Anaerolinea sp.]|nr:N-6 DNA methylase [Anaerolinea sp.]